MYFQPIARRKGDIQLIAKLQENCKMKIITAVKSEPLCRTCPIADHTRFRVRAVMTTSILLQISLLVLIAEAQDLNEYTKTSFECQIYLRICSSGFFHETEKIRPHGRNRKYIDQKEKRRINENCIYRITDIYEVTMNRICHSCKMSQNYL